MWINVALIVMAYIAVPHVSFCRWMALDGADHEDRAVALLCAPAVYLLWPLLVVRVLTTMRSTCR